MRNEPDVHEQGGIAAGGAPRRIYNPVQQDYASFVQTSAHTNGARTLIEIELAPGGGTTPHYHRSFSERFEVLAGELEVQLGRTIQRLTVGESATADMRTLHCFANPTPQPTRFLIELRPGHTGFEQGLQIVYGLASEGKTNAKSVPTNPYHLAVVLELGDTQLPGMLRVLLPVLRLAAARARRKGIEQALIDRYCR
jgi:mannose-6-phosphate isomerase-like protein (cupin superfamily)